MLRNVTINGNGNSNNQTQSPITADGRYITFRSNATNLVAGDTNGASDIFLYDLQTDLIINITILGNGNSNLPSMSADGKFIAFVSTASNLVPGSTGTSTQLFLYDVDNESLQGITRTGNQNTNVSSLSADGRYVLFYSDASNLVPNDTNGVADVFIYDRQTESIQNITIGGIGQSAIQGPSSISADGRFIVFLTNSNNLVPDLIDPYNGAFDVLIYDRQKEEFQNLTRNGDNISWYPSISADGRFIVFASPSTNFSMDDGPGNQDVFLYENIIEDNTPPVVTLSGSENITVDIGMSFVDPGATWTDDTDGAGVISSAQSGTVNTNAVGVYPLQYRYVDEAGNTGNVVTRNVYVVIPVRPAGGYSSISSSNPNTNNNTSSPNIISSYTSAVAVDIAILNPDIDPDVCYSPRNDLIVYQGNKVSSGFLVAHQLLYSYSLTTIAGTEDFMPDRKITRAEAAKFFVQFAQRVLCKEKIQEYDGRFTDITNTHSDLQENIKLSYEYGIFY